MTASADIFLALIAVLFPPIAVWIKSGICSGASLVNILLCLLGYLPGLLHAWYIIASSPDQSATAFYYEPVQGDALAAEEGRGFQARVPGPAGSQPPANGYVAPPPQLGPRAPNANLPAGYGTLDLSSSAAGPSNGPIDTAPPPTYDQAIRGDNKVQK